ncbi:MAG: RHS repeat-associated core domain-containing protein, partial [Acidobacteriales bacterium]|nr:RHS repeat-associated core domain-containing protein [Terriglobales bacterium]
GWYEGQDCATNPYGDNLACASAQGWTNPLTFSRVHYAGYDYNGSTGLDHTWFREYDPRLGRFLQADPLGGDASDPQSLNRFAYVGNNPGNLVDPLGLDYCVRITTITWQRINKGEWIEISRDILIRCYRTEFEGRGAGDGITAGTPVSKDGAPPTRIVTRYSRGECEADATRKYLKELNEKSPSPDPWVAVGISIGSVITLGGNGFYEAYDPRRVHAFTSASKIKGLKSAGFGFLLGVMAGSAEELIKGVAKQVIVGNELGSEYKRALTQCQQITQ